MFGITKNLRAHRKGNRRHQLGVENRLETRCVMSTTALVGGTLTITGSDKPDAIEVGLDKSGQAMLVSENGQTFAKFSARGINLIRIDGLGGDDKISVSDRIRVRTLIDGGDGDDTLDAGNGASALLGGAGNDMLSGGAGRDILVGGAGRDDLRGGGEDDILVGHQTAFDQKKERFLELLNAWNTKDDYEVRVKKLAGEFVIPPPAFESVTDLGDSLAGESGTDWFVTGGRETKVADQTKIEIVM